MSRPRRELVSELVGELRPVRRFPSPGLVSALWLATCLLAVVLATLAVQPLRPGVGSQLGASPRFAGEIVLGVAASLSAAFAAMSLGVPGAATRRRVVGVAALLAAAWLALLLAALVAPPLAASMAGKRVLCFGEVLAYGSVLLLLGLAVLRRSAPLGRILPGVLLGAAAGAVAALAMQLACVYDPAHAWTHHLAPAAAVAALGALLGPLLLRRL